MPRFRQAQKMDAVGQLTGGVAHDFNNILTVITGTIGILAEAVADKPELAAVAKLIDEAADRGANLTKHLLAFARKQPLQPREIDVNALVLETAKLLHPTLGEHIQITPLLAADAWTAMVDPNQLSTAILNLALNARDAMPNGGKLALETSNIYLDEAYAAMHSEVTSATTSWSRSATPARGSPPPIWNGSSIRSSPPRKSARAPASGSAWCSASSSSRAATSRSTARKATARRSRSTCRAQPGSSTPRRSSRAAAHVEGGHETVLVVEDDAMVRKYVITQVESLGYTTLEAANAAEALMLIDSNRGDRPAVYRRHHARRDERPPAGR